jgi:hypothetical protein
VPYTVSQHWASPRESVEFPTDVKGVVTLLGNSKTCGEQAYKQRPKVRKTESMSLVTRTLMALKIDRHDLTNRVSRGHVCRGYVHGFALGF